MLSIENVTFSYSRRKPAVLRDFNLTIDSGGVYGLLGPNGAGKSTLLYLIAGALRQQQGTILFKGVDTRKRLPSVLSDIYLVPEEFTMPSITMDEYVSRNAAFYPKFSQSDLEKHIGTFGLDPHSNLGALSMGQKKKALMCFALATNTSMLLMDEPTNGLDIPGKSSFRRFIASAMDEARTVIISTHQVRDVDQLLDHVIIMNGDGVIIDQNLFDISRKLKFATTDDRQLAEKALYSQRAIGGLDVILPNPDGEETDINLETLFQLALENPQLLKQTLTEQS